MAELLQPPACDPGGVFSHACLAQHGLTAGMDIHTQAWFRDRALPLHQFGLSDTLVFLLAP